MKGVTYFNKWGFSVNEGEGPINFCVLWRRPPLHEESWLFIYVFVYKWRFSWNFSLKMLSKIIGGLKRVRKS